MAIRELYIDSEAISSGDGYICACGAVALMGDATDLPQVVDNGGGEYVVCPGCGNRYYAAGDEQRFARPE